MKNPLIGVFDSGVGGLSVLRALWQELAGYSFIYLADQAHVPYGLRSLEQVRAFSDAITRYLLAQGTDLIVVACNTASAAALHALRATFPEIPFVGMEPAVKPAAEHTRSGAVGVLATPATFQGALYASVVERFANGVHLHQHTCPGLVAQIEAGEIDTPRTREILEEALHPMLAAGIDTVVLGCTHYPFVIPLIEEITGPDVRVIDPAPAVARQARRLLGVQNDNKSEDLAGAASRTLFVTTGDPDRMAKVISELIGLATSVQRVDWGKDLIAK